MCDQKPGATNVRLLRLSRKSFSIKIRITRAVLFHPARGCNFKGRRAEKQKTRKFYAPNVEAPETRRRPARGYNPILKFYFFMNIYKLLVV